MEKKCIAYSQWLDYIRVIKDDGIACKELDKIACSYPQVDLCNYQDIVYNELAKMEVILLRNVIENFQKSVNICLSENDLEYLSQGVKRFKRDVQKCFFFNAIDEFPGNMREKLATQMVESLHGFSKVFSAFVKNIEENESDLFISDFVYICKKARLKKFIEEQNIYV